MIYYEKDCPLATENKQEHEMDNQALGIRLVCNNQPN